MNEGEKIKNKKIMKIEKIKKSIRSKETNVSSQTQQVVFTFHIFDKSKRQTQTTRCYALAVKRHKVFIFTKVKFCLHFFPIFLRLAYFIVGLLLLLNT